jgi:hypothetical protein
VDEMMSPIAVNTAFAVELSSTVTAVGDIDPASLADAAASIAYRRDQLIALAHLVQDDRLDDAPDDIRQTLINAVADSALVNARALANFLKSTRPKPPDLPPHEPDAKVSDYTDPSVVDDFVPVAWLTHSVITKHVDHITVHDPDAPHPGSWPIGALAAVFASGVQAVIDSLPADDFEHRSSFEPRQPSPDERPHPDVVRLTNELLALLRRASHDAKR